MNQHLIHCPVCNTCLDKKTVEDGELIEKHCEKCKKDFVFKVEIKLRVFTESN
jgi:hypothetical protein